MIVRQGMFGSVVVRDTYAGERQLLINGQVQGGSYLSPGAEAVAPGLREGPGPISSSAYTIGWLLAGALNPTGSGLMVGLGSGAGAVELLYNFPAVDLTVVEIDPTVVELALRSFPLLEYYLNKGNLNIVIEDAGEYLTRVTDKWDFACVDGYTGAQTVEVSHMELAAQHADSVYVNVIDSLGGESMREVAAQLMRAGHHVKGVFKAIPLHLYATYPFEARANWILTTVEPDSVRVNTFTPFEFLSDIHSAEKRMLWDLFLASDALASA